MIAGNKLNTNITTVYLRITDGDILTNPAITVSVRTINTNT